MDKNISEILNVSENIENENGEKFSTSDETTLKIIANIILTVGIISSFILFFTITLITIPGEHTWESKTTFSASGFVSTLGVLFSSIAIWAFFRVISNISISLKELNTKNIEK